MAYESLIGNKSAMKCPKIVLRKFKEMLDNSRDSKDILCFQDACYSIGWRDSKVDYWVKKSSVFETIKKDIQNTITRRINKNALENTYNTASSIWRMKQLGEVDSKEIKQTVKDERKTVGDLFPDDEELED